MSIDPKILERLKKLLALEEGAKALDSLEEAAVAASKIQSLLLTYNLELADVQSHIAGSKKEDFEIRRIKVKDLQSKIEGKWIKRLFTKLCKYNLCENIVIYSPGHRQEDEIAIIGLTTNIDIVEFLAMQLIERLKTIEGRFWRGYSGPTKRNAYKRAFLMGAAIGIGDKLQIQWEAAQQSSVSVTALVVNNKIAIQNFIQAEMGNINTGKASAPLSGTDAMVKGYQTGKNMDIHKGLDDKKANGLRLLS